MKHKLLLLISFFILTNIVFGQTGTIKVAKPKKEMAPLPKIDSLPKAIYRHPTCISIGPNYTFKKNEKVGFEVGMAIYPRKLRFVGIGLQYSLENQYYELSAYNKHTQLIDVGHKKSQNKMEYIKIPIEVYESINYGSRGRAYAFVDLAPEYLIKNKNEFDRLHVDDFNRFNLCGYIGISFRIHGGAMIGVKYSMDFFENLKDRNIYDSNGNTIGKQKSKINLLTISFCGPG